MQQAFQKLFNDNNDSYKYIIVAASFIIMVMMAGVMYSYGIFFKHLVTEFGWSREMTSGVYSLFAICHGTFGIPLGILLDRFGPRKVIVPCFIAAGAGLVLCSQITALWQLYLTFGLIVGASLSIVYPGTMAITSRWFHRRRGLALGIVVSGIGIGTLFLIPGVERLIHATGWSQAFFIMGIVFWAIMIPVSFAMRRSLFERQSYLQTTAQSMSDDGQPENQSSSPGITAVIKAAARSKALWMLASFLFLFNICLQMTMVHLVNYATDIGVSSLIAATFLSTIGVSGFFGRILMGALTDKIGPNNTTLLCSISLGISFVILVFTREVWMFYLFAIVFGFSYGGEVPQTPALVGRYFGFKATASLVGVVVAFAGIGGALGAWFAGRVFDATNSYQAAFMVAIAVSVLIIIVLVLLKRIKPKSI